jgi:gas vesicle protein
MIKQGKNTIYCDECKAEIPQTKDLIETKHISGGIQINFFRCKKCGVKYLVSVTDKGVREKQQELRKWSEQYNNALDTNLDELSGKQAEKVAMLADECKFNMDRLQEEIKAAMAELKKNYKGEL